MVDHLNEQLHEALALQQNLQDLMHRYSDVSSLPMNHSERSLAAASVSSVNKSLRAALAILATEASRWGI